MSRYERRIYFEALCHLRERYAALPEADRIPVMTIEAAIAWAEAKLLLDPVPDVEAADAKG